MTAAPNEAFGSAGVSVAALGANAAAAIRKESILVFLHFSDSDADAERTSVTSKKA